MFFSVSLSDSRQFSEESSDEFDDSANLGMSETGTIISTSQILTLFNDSPSDVEIEFEFDSDGSSSSIAAQENFKIGKRLR